MLHGINTISMAHMLEIEHLISNEVNLRGGTRSNLNSLFLNISKPYFSAIKRVDEKQLKVSAVVIKMKIHAKCCNICLYMVVVAMWGSNHICIIVNCSQSLCYS